MTPIGKRAFGKGSGEPSAACSCGVSGRQAIASVWCAPIVAAANFVDCDHRLRAAIDPKLL